MHSCGKGVEFVRINEESLCSKSFKLRTKQANKMPRGKFSSFYSQRINKLSTNLVNFLRSVIPVVLHTNHKAYNYNYI